jgi:hypothetical protein
MLTRIFETLRELQNPESRPIGFTATLRQK